MTNKLKVGDKLYAYSPIQYYHRVGQPPELRHAEEYEIIKVGKKYYTVQQGCLVCRIEIDTLKEKIGNYNRRYTWFRSLADYEEWCCHRNLIDTDKITEHDK